MGNKRRIQSVLGGLFIIAVFVLFIVFAKPQASSDLKVYFFDVGQGDAEYIKLADGSDILIDGGPDDKVLTELGKAMNFGDREISLVVLSHPHADHLSGLIDVLRRYKVQEVWESGVDYPSATYDEWKSIIAEKNIPVKYVVAGDVRTIGSLNFKTLYPLSSFEKKTIDNINNVSVINRLDYGNFSALFLGDAEKPVQAQISGQMKPTTVLKVGHHGSGNATLEDFLKVVRPAIAVIEVGKDNKYGHPAVSTINILKQLAIRIYRTDQNGTVEISSDGQNYSVQTQR